MAKIERFEDLESWQTARELVRFTYSICKNEALNKDFSTKDQLKRAALSVMNNIAEGFGRYGVQDMIRFYNIAHASCLEVRSMSYVLLDVEYIDSKEFEKLQFLSNLCSQKINGFIKYLVNRAK